MTDMWSFVNLTYCSGALLISTGNKNGPRGGGPSAETLESHSMRSI